MTLARSFAIACACFMLITVLYGQQPENLAYSDQLTNKQMLVLDSLAADSTGGVLNVPNVFTPNDDGINDYFEVETDGVTVYEFMIFSRNGTRIFHSSSPRIFWDGRSNNGLSLKQGIYYYVIEETGSSEPFEKAGTIYLYR